MMLLTGCESLGSFDALLMLDDPKNVTNIMAAAFIEPYEAESMKNYFFEKTSILHRCRSKLVKHFGLYWFKKMDAQEFKEK